MFGPLQCSVQVDSFGKECLKENKHLYSYRGGVGVPPLAMVDDLLAVSNCGIETVKTNGFLNAKTNVKKLQFGGEKCHKMHVGKKQHLCPDLFVDNWELKKVDKFGHGIENLEDIYVGDYVMENVKDERYLGDIIAADGSNLKNVLKRKSKGVGVVSQIMTILENTCYGPYHFQVAVTLRESFLINGILTNSEAWYGLKNSELEILESVDELLMRRILEVPSTCPKEMLYLELGCLPIRYIVSARRLLFLHYIVNEDENALIKQVFTAQMNQPLKDDWCLAVIKDIQDFKMELEIEEIKKMSICKFQNCVKKAVAIKAFEDLNSIKLKHSKVMHIVHSKLEMQQYMKPCNLSIKETKFGFHARTRMVRVSKNYGQDKKCPVCKKDLEDSQPHLLVCEMLVKNAIMDEIPHYDDLFSEKLQKQVILIQMLNSNFKTRLQRLKKEN